MWPHGTPRGQNFAQCHEPNHNISGLSFGKTNLERINIQNVTNVPLRHKDIMVAYFYPPLVR
jgi:hypothetical protein